MNVLVVDDAENVRYSLRTSLEDAGFTVDEAVDGEEALDRLRIEKYTFLVIDIWMPRLNGVELLQQTRHLHPDMQVFVITGGAAHIPIESTAAMARTWGADQIFYKPFDNRDLVAAMRARAPA